MNEEINNYRFKNFGNKYFLTTDHGSFLFLDKTEFENLKKGKIDKNLRLKLEEKGIILNDNNFGKAINLFRKRNSFLYQGTSLHIVVPTLRCNMKCIYCHASSKSDGDKKYDMDQITAKKTVDFIFGTPAKDISVEFQGGEPTLNWKIVEYITKYALQKNKIYKKNMQLNLVTNFSAMDQKKMEFLIKNNILVCTSLDGPKNIHDHNRLLLGNSNYEQVIFWIKRFQKEYKKRKIDLNVGALVTLTKKSLKYPKQIIDEYVKLNIPIIHLRFLNNIGVAKRSWPKIKYSANDYLIFWKKAVKYIDELNKSGINIEERMIRIITDKIIQEFDTNYLEMRSPCGAAIGQLVYNYDGKIYTCDEGRMIEDELFFLGDVKKNKYKEIVTSDKACTIINASLNDQFVCDDCVYKPYCGLCPVCNYIEQGSIIGKIPDTIRCKIFKEQFNYVVKNKIMKLKIK